MQGISSESTLMGLFCSKLQRHSQKDTPLQQHEREMCSEVECVVVEGNSMLCTLVGISSVSN